MSSTYKTSLGTSARIITLAITALFFFLAVGPYFLLSMVGNKHTAYYTIPVCACIYIVAYAFHPINYQITENELIVQRPFFNARFDRSNIKSAELIMRNEIGGSIRTFGIGGLFGYTGTFANFSIGKMTWYVTRKDKMVLIEMFDNKKIVFSPDEPQKFAICLMA